MGVFYTISPLDVFSLGNAVIIAAQTAWQRFGYHLGLMRVMFMVFDYCLCMLGGVLGFKIAELIFKSDK